jgi:hypothetical protein
LLKGGAEATNFLEGNIIPSLMSVKEISLSRGVLHEYIAKRGPFTILKTLIWV